MKNPELKMIYNPFTVKTTTLLNGEATSYVVFDTLTKGKRLQQWIDNLFTPELFKILNTQELDFVFECTELGASDVRDAVDYFIAEHGNKYTLNSTYITHTVEADEKIQQLQELFKDAQDGPFYQFRSPEMHNAFEKALASEFDVTVLATMSAGKSTLINAMVGKELLPSKNEACTATIARVINDDALTAFKLRRIGAEGQVIDDWQTVAENEQHKIIEKWNEDKATSVIELKGNIPAINISNGIQMVLVDTPGPNNSNDPEHRASTVKAINSSQPSMVVYVLNATQLGVTDDQGLLNLIKEAMSRGKREAHDRFIFVANKVDTLDSDKETVASVIKNVKKYLVSNGIINPVVIPVSAELTKLIRIQRFYGKDALTKKQTRTMNGLIEQFVDEEDMNLLEHVRKDLPRSVYQNLKNQVDEAREQGSDEKVAELLSGIPIVEAILDAYLSKHAVPSRINDAVHAFKTVGREHDILKKLTDILEMNESDLNEAVKTLDEFNNSRSRLDEASNFRKKVDDMEHSISDETKKQRISIDRKVNALLDSLDVEFKKKMEPTTAGNIMEEADKKAKNLIAEIQEILTEDSKNDLNEKASDLKADYDKYVEDLLGNFPDSKSTAIIKDFQSSALEMPDVKTLVQQAIFQEEKEEFVGTERHGFLWLRKRNLYKTTIEDKVDMREVGKKFMAALRAAKFSLFESSEIVSADNFNSVKKTLLNHMQNIDCKLNNLIIEMQEAQENRANREEAIKENNLKKYWYEQFESKLNKVIDIRSTI